MKMRAFWSQVGFRNFFLKVFSVFQKWTFINVQNRFSEILLGILIFVFLYNKFPKQLKEN